MTMSDHALADTLRLLVPLALAALLACATLWADRGDAALALVMGRRASRTSRRGRQDSASADAPAWDCHAHPSATLTLTASPADR